MKIEMLEKAIKQFYEFPEHRPIILPLGKFLYKEAKKNKQYRYHKIENKEYIWLNGLEVEIMLNKPLPKGAIICK